MATSEIRNLPAPVELLEIRPEEIRLQVTETPPPPEIAVEDGSGEEVLPPEP